MSIQAGVVQKHLTKPGPFSPILQSNPHIPGPNRSPFVMGQGNLVTSHHDLL